MGAAGKSPKKTPTDSIRATFKSIKEETSEVVKTKPNQIKFQIFLRPVFPCNMEVAELFKLWASAGIKRLSFYHEANALINTIRKGQLYE